MDGRRQDGEAVKRRGISLTEYQDRLARWLAVRGGHGGNVSLLIGNLLEYEARRFPDAPQPERPSEGVAA